MKNGCAQDDAIDERRCHQKFKMSHYRKSSQLAARACRWLQWQVPRYFQHRESEVACPYFMPIARLENGSWPHPARLPLGCGWSGHCTAPGHEHSIPSQDVLESFCNLGYAASCDWAPTDLALDAVRFAVAAPEKVASAEQSSSLTEPARMLRITYVYERDHRPAGRGELEFDLAGAAWVRPHQDPRIQKMAECFLESYLTKKN